MVDTTVNNVGLLGASQNTLKSAAGLAQNFDDFLKLLTTQLQNQDPLQPMDSTQFTTQLVQFASVEQQIGQNARLDEIVKLQGANQAVSAVSFLDDIVEAFGSTGLLKDGSADYTYSLASPAQKTTITIKNEAGDVVRTLDGETTAGKHGLTWDGKNDQGLQLPDGKYSITVTATGDNKAQIDTTTGIVGKVIGVTVEDGQLVLDLGGVKVKVTDVLSVTKPSQTASQ
jgi:flagellar basal-body rod modification protein FlgD